MSTFQGQQKNNIILTMIIIHMDRLQMLRENIFTQIAKLLALSQLKKEIPKAIKELEGNPEVQASLESLKYHVQEADDLLTYLCKKYPDNPKCKQKGKSK